jgi:phosphoribosylformylglycinamidine (FGAM) synthase PurS component
MLRRFTRIVTGMVVYPDRMLENSAGRAAVVFSGSVLLELARRGVSREQAYEWVQRNAMRSFAEHRDFKALLAEPRRHARAARPKSTRRSISTQLATPTHFSPRVRPPPGVRLNRPTMKARVFVTLKPPVFDPRAHTSPRRCTRSATTIVGRAAGKYFELDVATDEPEHRPSLREVADACSPTVIESFRIERAPTQERE